MRTLLEELEERLFRRRETGVTPLPMSRVLSNEKLTVQDISRRNSEISKFFRESKSGFTYEEFKEILKPALSKEITLFGVGPEAKEKISQFAKGVKIEGDEKNITYYDEYVETFFIYFYYQLFVKLFAETETIITKNAESIKNAKSIISKVPEANRADLEESLLKLYRSFYTMFSASTENVSSIAKNKAEQAKYFENFANNNIELFSSYPLSGYVEGSVPTDLKGFVDLLFESMESFDFENTGNRQIASIGVLSKFISAENVVDFDVANLGETLKITFTGGTAAKIDDTLNALASIEDVSNLGMGWTKGTKWEPYVKMLCAMVCLEEISESVKKVASKMKSVSKATFVKKLDMGEADDGLFFINAKAFSKAIGSVEELKDCVKDLNSAIDEMARKTEKIQARSGKELLETLFFQESSDLRAIDIEDLKQKESIKKILQLTGMMENMKVGTLNEATAEINLTLFSPDNKNPPGLIPRNEDAINYAKVNVGDVILDEIDPGKFRGAFDVEKIVDTVVEIGSSTAQFFDTLFDKTFGDQGSGNFISNVVDSFNSAFSQKFNFVKMTPTKNAGEFVLTGGSGNKSHTFKTPEDYKNWIKTMSVSLENIMYHSKVCFGGPSQNPEQGKEQRYEEYFNLLSWFINVVKEKKAVVASSDFKLVYLVTPFFLESVKYSLRCFINEIQDIVDINKDLRNRIKETHTKSSVPEEEWKTMVDELSTAVEKYMANKMGRQIASQSNEPERS